MTERLSNSEFLTISPALPIDSSGWEVRVISPHDWTTIIGFVRNWRKLGGSTSVNDFGSGFLELNTNNPILTTPFPAGLEGTIRQGEFLWQFWRDGVLRHEWISDDETENEVSQSSSDNVIKFSGRTLEKVLTWPIHRPIWAERQSYDVTGNPTGGTYRLKNPDTGEVTPPIAWNASAAEVHAAIHTGFSDVDPADIEVVAGNWDGTPYEGRYNVLFKGGLTGVDYPRLEGSDVLLTGGSGEMKIESAARDSNNTWEDMNSTIIGRPAIASVLAHLERAQARGVLPFLDVTFSATHDSAGVAWSDLTDVTISPGEDLLALLQRLSDMLGWEFRMLTGFKLWVVQDGYGAHHEAEVTFFKSGQQIQHERTSSSRDVVTDVFTQSSKFEVTHNTAESPVTPWRREAWIEAGGSPTTSSASQVGLATLDLRKEKRVSRTISVPAELETRKVFVDYALADWITIETSDGMEGVKVVGLSFSSDADVEFGLEIVIMSAFEAREVRTQKMLEALGSKAATGGQGSSPTGSAPVQRAVGVRDLTDVNLGGMQEGDILQRSGAYWVVTRGDISFLTDVDTEGTPPTEGQALIWDSSEGQWIPGSPPAGATDWDSVTGKPATFPPSTHTHTAADISDSTTVGRNVLKAVDAAAARTAIGAGTSSLALGTTAGTAKAGDYAPAWADVTSKPATFPPDAHTHTLSTLTDVDTTGYADGKVLTWDSTAAKWVPETPSGGGGSSTLAGLTDVDLTGLTDGDILVWDATAAKWERAVPPSGGGSGSSLAFSFIFGG